MTRRPLLVTAGWIGAAVLAVLVGLAAISVIGNGLTGSEARPLSAAEVADELARQQASVVASAVPSASAGTGTRPPASPSTTAGTRTLPTRGGTVVGRCAGSRPEIVSMSPKQGFELHERDRGPQDGEAEGEFRGLADNHDRVKFDVVCAAGRPGLVLDRED
ncbi:hypothetical protein [Actinoplanes friuliensis]|uniref:hypothetical protein n=1 Tax=Actinoplanes friuliensis TaxID=196914 RepID=UPI001EE63BAB|nr:hypothetical protein [Actinoplanes friuliensis]